MLYSVGSYANPSSVSLVQNNFRNQHTNLFRHSGSSEEEKKFYNNDLSLPKKIEGRLSNLIVQNMRSYKRVNFFPNFSISV